MSASPGWYPDPEDPARVRHWDGAAWATSPGGQGTAPGQGSGPRRWWVLAAAVLALAVLGALLLPRLLPADVAQPDPDPTGPRPTGSQWDELPPTQTPTATDEPSSGEEVSCPSGDPESGPSASGGGWIRGGGIAFRDPGEPWGPASLSNLPWAHDADGLRSSGGSWYNVLMVGALHAEEGFTEARGAARTVFDCQASGAFYNSVLGSEIHTDEPITVDGVDGWYVRGLIHSSSGLVDRVDVIVLEGGDRLSSFHGVVNSEEDARVADLEEAIESLRFED